MYSCYSFISLFSPNKTYFGDVTNQSQVLSSIIGEVYKRLAGGGANTSILRILQKQAFDPRWLTQHGLDIDTFVHDSRTFIECAIGQLKKYTRYTNYHLYDEGADKEALRFLIEDENEAEVYVPNAGFGEFMLCIEGIPAFESKTYHVENRDSFPHAIATVRAYIHGLSKVKCHLLPTPKRNTRPYSYILAYIRLGEEDFMHKLFLENTTEVFRMVAMAPKEFSQKRTYHREFLTQALVDIIECGNFEWWIVDSTSRTQGIYLPIKKLLEKLPDSEFKKSIETKMDEINISPIGYFRGDYFNAYRKILDDVCKYLYSYGLTNEELTLNELARFLPAIRQLEDQLQRIYKDQSITYEYCIPPYVSFSLELCNRVSQEGCHGDAECTRLYVGGKAPYLNHSVLYSLLNVLQWVLSLPTDAQKEAYLEKVRELIYAGREGEVEYDDELNCYHMGLCCLSAKDIFAGRQVRINSYTNNRDDKTKDKYPIFTRDCTVLD